MSPLRARFTGYLELKGFSKASVRNYVQVISQFSRHIGKSPVKMTRSDVENYLLHLKRVKKLEARTINLHFYALRSFCTFMLPESDIMKPFGRMREPQKQPQILSRQEVEKLIEAADNLKRKAIVALLYSSGIRLNECVHLTPKDIDSGRMVMHILCGKGAKDRYAVLSERALHILRDYYRKYRPAQWLFEGGKEGHPLHPRTIGSIVSMTALKAGIGRSVSPHILRHSLRPGSAQAFATHLLEAGIPLQVIQRLLGHAKIQTTSLYTQVSAELLHSVKSPFDTPVPPTPATPQPQQLQLPLPIAPVKRAYRRRKSVTLRRRSGKKGGRK
jgi:integrase/recombinase XerD